MTRTMTWDDLTESQRTTAEDFDAITPEQIAAAAALHDALVPIFGRTLLRLATEIVEQRAKEQADHGRPAGRTADVTPLTE